MPSPLLGKWKLGESENFDEYMKAVGVNVVLRKAGAALSSTSEITDEGNNKIRINTQSTFKSANVVFPVGEEMEEKTMDGRTCKTTLVWEGDNKLHQVQVWDDGKRRATLDWIFENDAMILVESSFAPFMHVMIGGPQTGMRRCSVYKTSYTLLKKKRSPSPFSGNV